MTSRTRFTPWRGGPRASVPAAGDSAGVRLLTAPARLPATPIERLLVDTLTVRGPLARTALVSAVARTLYQDELAQSGWLAALGFFNESVFTAEVTRALEGARDVLWEFEGADGGAARLPGAPHAPRSGDAGPAPRLP